MKKEKTFKEDNTECLTVKEIEKNWTDNKRKPGKTLDRHPYTDAKPGFKPTITRAVNYLTENHYISKKGDRPALYYMDDNQRMMCRLTIGSGWIEDELDIESENVSENPDLKNITC